MGAHGHHEPHPVHRGDQPAAPRLGQGDVGLGVDQHGVGRLDGLGPHVALVDVQQPIPGQGVDTRRCHRFEPDVHRIGTEHGRHRQAEVGDAGLVARGVGERLGETGMPAHHLRDQFRQVHTRDHRLHPAAQVDQRRGLGLGVQRGDVQFAVGVDAGWGVLAQPCGQLPISGLQRRRVIGQQLRRRGGQAQRVHAGVTRSLPGFACQQVRPRVAPPRRTHREDAAVLEVSVELFQHADRVGVPVDGALRSARRVDQALPRADDQVVVDLAGVQQVCRDLARRPGCQQLGEGLHCRQDGGAVTGRAELDRVHQHRQERADRGELAGQLDQPLPIQLRVVGGHQLVDRLDRVPQLGPGDGLLDHVQHHAQPDVLVDLDHLQQHLHRCRELACVA
ncbi:Uncharacterised protein [Mycobacteroides abscessus subsp. massiliense]|nr:Uncharacterised protein [Mycobacteroides abscessus subsp. massiliense]